MRASRTRPSAIGPDLGGLIERERQVLTLIARGRSANVEIAASLTIAVSMVKMLADFEARGEHSTPVRRLRGD